MPFARTAIFPIAAFSALTFCNGQIAPAATGSEIVRPGQATPVILDRQPEQRNIPRLAPASEPGEQIVISGTVLNPEGLAPVPGARIFAYQPDARGFYAAVPGEPKNIARLRGIFTADAAGRYAFATIKPGQVPKRGEPAQIRIHVAPPGTSDADLQRYNWAIDDLWFEGDTRISPSMALNAQRKGRFSPLVRLERRNGVSYGTANLHLSYR